MIEALSVCNRQAWATQRAGVPQGGGGRNQGFKIPSAAFQDVQWREVELKVEDPGLKLQTDKQNGCRNLTTK